MNSMLSGKCRDCGHADDRLTGAVLQSCESRCLWLEFSPEYSRYSDRFLRSYLVAMLWTDLPDGCCRPGGFDGSDACERWLKRVTRETREKAEADCRHFCLLAGPLIDSDPERAATDFWLTRNGHGAGFWDGDWSHVEPVAPGFDDAGEQLTAIAKLFGQQETYMSQGWFRIYQ